MEENIPTDLIVRYLSNETSNEESEKLLDWVADNSANQKVFAEWTKAWNYQFPYHSPFDVSKGLTNVNERIDAYESSTKFGWSFNWAKIAVITLAVSVVGVMTLAIYHEGTTSIQYSEFRVSSGIDSVNLPDGSEIVLKANSSIKYPSHFPGKSREVSLEGEAFFKVKKDTEHPFIVKTENLTTEVLGTSFNIRSGQHYSVVTVATGRVKVSGDKDALVLWAHEKATYSNANKKILKANSDLSELEWYPPSRSKSDGKKIIIP